MNLFADRNDAKRQTVRLLHSTCRFHKVLH